MPVRYSTASRRVFDGIVPVLVHTPPSIRSRSMTATVLPSLAAAMAAFCPPGPEPMTTRSYSRVDGCMCVSSTARGDVLPVELISKVSIDAGGCYSDERDCGGEVSRVGHRAGDQSHTDRSSGG